MKKAIFIAILFSPLRAYCAFPVILVDTTNVAASDFKCSGAGPSTAIFGSTLSIDASGLIVTLNGSPNLTNVSTDGSHALFISNPTGRNFGRIVGKDGSLTSTASITVDTAFQTSISSSMQWGIGGVRATIASTTSVKLFSNGAIGDLQPGWIVDMAAVHIETVTASISFNASGSQVAGPIILRGNGGAIINFTNNGNGFIMANSRLYTQLQSFEIRNSNATKTASVAIIEGGGSTTAVYIRNMKINNSAFKFWRGISVAGVYTNVEECDIGNTADSAIVGTQPLIVWNNFIHDTGASAVSLTGNVAASIFIGNLFKNITGSCISDARTTTNVGSIPSPFISYENTFYGCVDGINNSSTVSQWTLFGSVIRNNIFSNNSGYALDFTGTGAFNENMNAMMVRIQNNDTFSNTSGPIFPSTNTIPSGDPQLDPQFTNVSGNNFSIGTNLKAKGYPLGGTLPIGSDSATFTYDDIGVAQRQETGGSTGTVGYGYIQ